jgi:4-alpha-glucanotransferase
LSSFAQIFDAVAQCFPFDQITDEKTSMKISFQINYHTDWGQRLVVTGSTPELGNWDPAKALRLEHIGNGNWVATLELDDAVSSFEYKYALADEWQNLLDTEWGANRRAAFQQKPARAILKDAWRAKFHPENTLYSSAFEEVIFKPGKFKAATPGKVKDQAVVQFQIHAPRVEPNLQLCVSGSDPALGSWDLTKPLLLGSENFPLWSGAVALEPGKAVEYKFGWYDPAKKHVKTLENGTNRLLDWDVLPAKNEVLIVTDEYFNHGLGNWKGAGVAMPVFSLRSEKGLGVGEFTDIRALVDWAKKAGMRMVQILPINDTNATNTWVDSYPYAAISVFALHPLYLNVSELEGFKKIIDQKAYEKERKQLNELDVVNYEAVMSLKLKYARQLFEAQREAFLKEAGFQAFLKENQHWLKPYALFCCLRDEHGTTDFNQWGAYSRFSDKMLKKETAPGAQHFDKIAFYYYLQYHLDRQLKAAAGYARENGIILKGDIPIGIYRYSVDAWTEPQLYNMDGQAGAPPDPFSDIGQNWGFPTYNWEEMEKDGYQWWQNRLKQLSRYFDAFRIDHILGFFRIWEIPLEQVEGTLGYFNRAIPVPLHEFAGRGIRFDFDRYCKPYITADLLNRTFGDEALFVAQTFLDVQENGNFYFKKGYDTQRKIAAFFSNPEQAANAHLKDRLFKFVSNVLFFEVPGSGGQAFHPRIDFQKTYSFKQLGEGTQRKLEELYNHYFYRKQDDFWREQAMKKLPAIKNATNMLVCGEDLGMVPGCVPGVMRDLGILTLEIQRMSKNPKTEFLMEDDIPYLSVCSPSTHDMPPLRLWWEESEQPQLQRFYSRVLGFEGRPPAACEPYVAERVILQHLGWPGMWTVFPIQDLLALSETLRRENPAEERINVPANPQHYWQYRLHLTLEQLVSEEAFNGHLQKLVKITGRG